MVYDSDNVDCEGYFMELKGDKKVLQERLRLEAKWDEQRRDAEQHHSKRKTQMEGLLRVSPRDDSQVEPEENEDQAVGLIPIKVSSLDVTLDKLKSKIEEMSGIAPSNQTLTTMEGKLLSYGDHSLRSFGIEHRSVIRLVAPNINDRLLTIICPVGDETSHAMVLIGALDRKGPLKMKHDPYKRLYILWNSWSKMPLVAVSLDYLIALRCEIHFLRGKLPSDLTSILQTSEGLACDCAPSDLAGTTFDFVDYA